MRVIKGIVLFCFSVIVISGCFDPPEFSDTPRLTFNDIKFKEVGGLSDADSIIIYLDFEDGNGDVGLSSVDPADFEYPYDPELYFVTSGTNDTTPVTSEVMQGYTIINPDSLPGKLVTSKTRSLPGYGYLPVYDPTSCVNYTFLIDVLTPLSSVDASYDIRDTLRLAIGSGKFNYYAVLREALLTKPNPNHYNIDITFLQFKSGGFVEFDWLKEYCITYNGRFSTSLNDFPSYDDRPIEGTIRYAMANTSFLQIFGNTPLKVKARIRDRALHVSNEVVSRQFELLEIRD